MAIGNFLNCYITASFYLNNYGMDKMNTEFGGYICLPEYFMFKTNNQLKFGIDSLLKYHHKNLILFHTSLM